MKILVINAGSSTHKCAIFENGGKIPVWSKTVLLQPIKDVLKELLKSDDLSDLKAIGHRVVHGGSKFQKPVLITQDVMNTIKDLCELAPLHNPANLEGIKICQELFPGVPQVAVFDTAFHMQIGQVAHVYALPLSIRKEGIRRFGFHGISHEYCMGRASEMVKELKNPKMITCHLGNGASLAAIHDGHSIDTTMGFTPMEGLMMGSRSGTIDPGIIFYLINQKNFKAEDLDRDLNYNSGLKGISGGFSDMREIIQKMDAGVIEAKLAFEMFVYSLNGFIGKMAASLQGLDILVFTAGIGENSQLVRERCCSSLEYLGIRIDPELNASCDGDCEITGKDSKVRVLVIKTEEEYAISQKCLQMIE